MSSRPQHWVRRILGAAVVCTAVALPGLGEAVAPRSLHVNVSVPSVLAVSGTDMWLANTGTGSVLEFSIATGNEIRQLGGHKYSLYNSDAMAVVGTKLWVANAASNSVTVIDTGSGSLVRFLSGTLDHFGMPQGLVADDGHVFILGRGGSALVVVDASTGKVLHVEHGAGAHLDHATALTVVGGEVWVLSTANGGWLSDFRASDGHLTRVITAHQGKLDVPTALVGAGGQLWVSNAAGAHLSVFDGLSGRLLKTPTTKAIDLNASRNILVYDNRVWLTGLAPHGWVACLRERDLYVVRDFQHRFGYPAPFAGGGYVWIVDRTQSRVTQLDPVHAYVRRVLFN